MDDPTTWIVVGALGVVLVLTLLFGLGHALLRPPPRRHR